MSEPTGPPTDGPPPSGAGAAPPDDLTGFAKHFTEAGFWQKVKDYAAKIGRGPLQKALELYRVAMSTDTPLWAKMTALGALGYLILPLDVIPDFVPVVGLTDDIAALGAAAAAIVSSITPAIKEQARQQVSQWLGLEPLPPQG